MFDYINGKLYFSPLHYNSWKFVNNEPVRIGAKEPDFTAEKPNAFYWITNITVFHEAITA